MTQFFGRFQIRKFCRNLLKVNFSAQRKAFSSTMGEPSIFTKIINREIPSTILHEDDKCIAFVDINGKAPTHFLVVPKEPLKGISSATEAHTQLLGHLMVTAKKVAEAQKLTNGYRLVINDGKDGGQEVLHLHIHMLGGRQMGWPPG